MRTTTKNLVYRPVLRPNSRATPAPGWERSFCGTATLTMPTTTTMTIVRCAPLSARQRPLRSQHHLRPQSLGLGPLLSRPLFSRPLLSASLLPLLFLLLPLLRLLLLLHHHRRRRHRRRHISRHLARFIQHQILLRLSSICLIRRSRRDNRTKPSQASIRVSKRYRLRRCSSRTS